MPEALPERLKSVLAAVETVCAEFAAKGSFRPYSPGRWIRDLTLDWANEIRHVAFVLDTEAPLLAVYVILRMPENTGHRDLLASGIARANYGLLPGCFELDLNTGETRYRSVLQLYCNDLDARAVAQLLSGALLMTKAYAPAFQRIAVAGVDPLDAVDEIESASQAE